MMTKGLFIMRAAGTNREERIQALLLENQEVNQERSRVDANLDRNTNALRHNRGLLKLAERDTEPSKRHRPGEIAGMIAEQEQRAERFKQQIADLDTKSTQIVAKIDRVRAGLPDEVDVVSIPVTEESEASVLTQPPGTPDF